MAAESLLEGEFLSRLEYLHIMTRELFVGHSGGERVSKKYGMGMEFADHRAYVAGDDFRYVDWSAYAQRETLLIKLFSEEQSSPIYVLLDVSGSMATGSPDKFFYGKKIAAALGYIGIANLEQVTVVPFDSELRDRIPTYQGRGKLQQMLAYLDELTPGTGTQMGAAVSAFARRFSSRRGIVILISDFLDGAGFEEAIKLLHYHRFELIAIQVNSREEMDPSFTGDYELVDSETQQQNIVQMTGEVVARYKAQVEAHYAHVHGLCKAMRRVCLPVLTDTPFEELILDVFRKGGLLR